MADPIVCPVCGESNPADMEFCRNCQSRLKPLTGALKRENAPIQPGDLPTKKVTSELEPLLPQWLRDARQQARDSAAEEASKAPEEEPSAPASPASDLLAGLASQSKDEDEEVPEWLAHITGAPSKKKKAVPEDNQVKWVELGRGEETLEPPLNEGQSTTAAQTPGSEEQGLTDWFKQAAASSETADFRLPPVPPATQQSQPEVGPAQPETPSWLRNLDATSGPQEPSASDEAPRAREEAPDWLKRMQAEQTPPEAPQPPKESAPFAQSDVPDWLRRFGEEAPAVPEPQAPTLEPPSEEPLISEASLPDWLKAAEPSAPQAEPVQPEAVQPTAEAPIIPTELPDWILSLGETQQAAQTTLPSTPAFETEPPTAQEPIVPSELPDWISSLAQSQETPQSTTPITPAFVAEPSAEEGPAISAELPDWISSLRPSQESPDEAAPTTPAFGAEPSKPNEPGISAGLPDWISSLRPSLAPSDEKGADASAFELEEPKAEAPSTGGAFGDKALSGEDADAIFASIQTPDWLAGVTPGQSPTAENAPAAAEEEEAIGPAELPSWVQAMRPVESAMASAPGTEKETLAEERGPLAGLQGVLPPFPGAAVSSSKPKAHSIKLDATEQQQAHAALLEQILAAETSPIPMRAGTLLRSQRLLRWGLSLLLIMVVGAAVFSGTQIFPLPTGVSSDETGLAMAAVDAVPADAPVLVVFDYQPSTVGEMEATGGPLLDHLLLLKHPRLALLSTSPTGPALAERFMSTTLANRGYARDQQYVDLGYLPGGLAGVYNFAQNPQGAVPLDANSKPVWQTAIWGPVTRFSDFAAIIVLTDSVEAGRSWIEQTSFSRGNSLMIIAASAQAGPMLLPYVDSGQVNGLVSGLNGGAAAEQANAGSPGTVRHYWDAYSIGLYLAAGLIVLGGLWSLLLGIRDRRAQAVG